MKLLGATGATLAGAGMASGVAGAKDYRTITVPSGGRKVFRVGSGETLENLLIDCTASDADARIVASGTGWTIRNVGFKGEMDHGASGGYPNHIAASGEGRIENVYVGNGVVGGTRKGGIGVGANHSGHIDLVRTHIAGWSDNGIYAAGMARSNGGHGTLAFDSCYLHDNNVSSLRIASGGTTVKNTVVHNTGNAPTVSTCGCVNARGVYDGYGTESDVVTFDNVDIKCTDGNTNGATSALVAAKTTFEVKNSQVDGELIGNVDTTNVGNDPDVTPPEGVPMTAEEAAKGASSAGSTGGSATTSDDSSTDGESTTSDGDATSDSDGLSNAETTDTKSKQKSASEETWCFETGDGSSYCISLSRLSRILARYF
ncbi:hypothetical protein [Halomicrococcus gelatinilyticus]|uniref:hypothetical protein n=1 Tax=Halomicrococcus gelatinilyticus TaxID=1702103 RepID=UPI002E12617F